MEKESEVSNLLIVESKNDKIFIEAIIRELNYDIEIDEPICKIDDYKCLEGLSEKTLVNALNSLAADIQKKDVQKIGIVIDMDKFSEEERLAFIDKCIKQVFQTEATISNICEFIEILTPNQEKLQLACYFTNVDGKGELETVLRNIKTEDSTYADCLENWRECLNQQGKLIKDKDYDKFWVNLYIRYDTCSRSERTQAERKCSMKNFEYVMENKKGIWDFNHPILANLKAFLRLFVSET